jgi:hypothetical protein
MRESCTYGSVRGALQQWASLPQPNGAETPLLLDCRPHLPFFQNELFALLIAKSVPCLGVAA